MTKWLPAKGVCNRYGISERTLDRWVETKNLPTPVFIRGRRYWPVEQLDQHDEARLAVAQNRSAA